MSRNAPDSAHCLCQYCLLSCFLPVSALCRCSTPLLGEAQSTRTAKFDPTSGSTSVPTSGPTRAPTRAPTRVPTRVPTNVLCAVSALRGLPTKGPTKRPTRVSTEAPTKVSAKAVSFHMSCFHMFCSLPICVFIWGI